MIRLKAFIAKHFTFLHHVSSSLVLSGITSLMFFFITPSLLHNLGKERYGVWILLFNIISYFNISNLGITSAFFYEFAKKKAEYNEANTLFNTVFWGLLYSLVLPFVVLSVLLLGFDSWFKISAQIATEVRWALFCLCFSFCSNYLSQIFDNIVYAHKKITTKNGIDIARVVASGLVLITLNYMGVGLAGLALAEAVFSLFRMLVFARVAYGLFPYRIRYSFFDKAILKRNIQPSLYYFLGTVSGMLAFQTDSLLISTLMGAQFVAGYAIMYRFVNVTSSVLGSLSGVKIPKVSEMLEKKNYRAIVSMHNKLYATVLALLIPISATIYFFGGDIIELWIGKKVDFNQSILTVFVAFLFISNLSHISGRFNNALGIHKVPIQLGVLESVLNIALSLFLYQHYGLKGIALGTLLSHALLGGWFATFYFYRHCRRQLSSM